MSREARVMRYKEKRRNRLFAKRIRYEVRKFNAEKRPRVKVNIPEETIPLETTRYVHWIIFSVRFCSINLFIYIIRKIFTR